MFVSPLDFFALVIAIAALIFARKAYVDARRFGNELLRSRARIFIPIFRLTTPRRPRAQC